MSSGVYRIPKIETDVTVGRHQHDADRARARRRAGRRRRRCSSGRWTCSRPRSALDPAEVRRRNFIAADAFPVDDRLRRPLRLRRLRAVRSISRSRPPATTSCAASRSSGAARGGPTLQLGIGVSAYVEITNGINETEFGAVEITPDGEAIVRTARSPRARATRRRSPRSSPTDWDCRSRRSRCSRATPTRSPRGTGTYGSKSTQIGGAAAAQGIGGAGASGPRSSRPTSSRRAPRTWSSTSSMVASTSPARRSRRSRGAELATRLLARTAGSTELSAEADFEPAQPTFPFGAHVAVVEVDTETGRVQLSRMIAVDDAGHDHQPTGRRGPGPRRRRRRDRAGAVRGAPLRRAGQPAERQPRHLRDAVGPRAADRSRSSRCRRRRR